jgi:hypothetical protein
MKIAALLLITFGTIGATVGVARTVPSVPGWQSAWQVQGTLTILSLATMLAGIAIQRREHGSRITSPVSSGTFQWPCAALECLQAATTQLESTLDQRDLQSLHQTLEAIVSSPIADFVENRTAISERHGIRNSAAVMGPFATAERCLNRAWSASADGYWHEADTPPGHSRQAGLAPSPECLVPSTYRLAPGSSSVVLRALSKR